MAKSFPSPLHPSPARPVNVPLSHLPAHLPSSPCTASGAWTRDVERSEKLCRSLPHIVASRSGRREDGVDNRTSLRPLSRGFSSRSNLWRKVTMAQPAQHLYLLLLSMLSVQLAFGMPLERSERALGSDGVSGAEKGAIHRQRLALYNLLESPGYNPDLERQPISRYIPLGLGTRHQAVFAPYKEIPLVPQVYSSDLVIPPNLNRAPYAKDQFIHPLDYHQLYPYLPPAMYAPAYPYKTVVPEEVP